MADLYAVEVEPEVRASLEALSDRDFGRVDFLVGLLAEQAETLSEPYTRHLEGKVRELRFHLLRQQTRVTYWLAPGGGWSCSRCSARPAARKPPTSPARCAPNRPASAATVSPTTASTETETPYERQAPDLREDRRAPP